VGAGGQGNSWARRLKKWKSLNGNTFEVVAMSDINDIVRKKRENEYSCKTYADYNEMFDKEKLDAIIIAAPHYVHAPITIAAAERNINVLCEKPMCINLKQADAMAEAVKKHKITFAVGFQHRFNPLLYVLKKAIDNGDLGEIFQLNMIYHWWRKEDYYLNSSPVPENKDEDWEGWRGHWKTEGGGALANQIVHFMDVFQWLSPSPIKAVSGVSRVAKHTFVETEDNANVIVEFENDSMGLIQAGVAYEHDREETFKIYGTKGALTFGNNMKKLFGIPKFYEDRRPKEIRKQHSLLSYRPKGLDPSKSMFTNFVDAIKNDSPESVSVGVDEGRKSVALLRAIHLSQKYQKKITFPYDDPIGEYPDLPHTYEDPDLV
jgi:predicted dehydrogenase